MAQKSFRLPALPPDPDTMTITSLETIISLRGKTAVENAAGKHTVSQFVFLPKDAENR